MIENSQPVYYGAGSQAVADAIERYQPTVGLHGHIHESRGMTRYGRTQAFNPGSEYGEGVLRGLIVAIRGGGSWVNSSPPASPRREREGGEMAEAVAPQVFTRRASGLVRVMSPYSAFIYNILTMGIIFPWTYM